MGRSTVAAIAAAVVGAAFCGSAAAASPHTQTFEHKRLGLTFTLPSDWIGAWRSATVGPEFEGAGPAQVAKLHVTTAQSPLTLSQVASSIIQGERRQLKGAPGVSISRRTTNVGRTTAVEITIRYRGLWTNGVGAITHLVYAFKRGEIVYLFDYSSWGKWVAKERAVFDASVRSISFAPVA